MLPLDAIAENSDREELPSESDVTGTNYEEESEEESEEDS